MGPTRFDLAAGEAFLGSAVSGLGDIAIALQKGRSAQSLESDPKFINETVWDMRDSFAVGAHSADMSPLKYGAFYSGLIQIGSDLATDYDQTNGKIQSSDAEIAVGDMIATIGAGLVSGGPLADFVLRRPSLGKALMWAIRDEDTRKEVAAIFPATVLAFIQGVVKGSVSN